jgi:hypothetical protein
MAQGKLKSGEQTTEDKGDKGINPAAGDKHPRTKQKDFGFKSQQKSQYCSGSTCNQAPRSMYKDNPLKANDGPIDK